MITSQQIKSKALSKYYSYLSSIVSKEDIFPLEIPSNKLPGKDLEVYRKEIEDLIAHSNRQKKYGYTLQVNKTRTKYLGTQSLPKRIYFESEVDFVGYLNKLREVDDFKQVVNQTLVEFPILKDWLQKSTRKVVPKLSVWSSILKVCVYFENNRLPNLYIRELPISVHTKFIENHKPILKELLDIILINSLNSDSTIFEKRFHLKYAQPLVRFKILDSQIAKDYFSGNTDISLPVNEFKTLSLPLEKVIIVENKTTLYTTLTLPQQEKTIAIFGKGFQVKSLENIEWLNYVSILYWGDIDAHGFQILSQLRSYHKQTKSILMDKETFVKFYDNGIGSSSKAILKHLTTQEEILFNELKENNSRLEQEKISHKWVVNAFNKR